VQRPGCAVDEAAGSVAIVLLGLLAAVIWWYSEIVLVAVASAYAAGGVVLHVVRFGAPSSGFANRVNHAARTGLPSYCNCRSIFSLQS
jgi:hypothetical protein